jgi:hypothetical protein
MHWAKDQFMTIKKGINPARIPWATFCLSSKGIMEPFFFEGTVTGISYLMLQVKIMPCHALQCIPVKNVTFSKVEHIYLENE